GVGWLLWRVSLGPGLFALLGRGAMAGYGGGLEVLATGARRWTNAPDRAGLWARLRRVGLPSLSSAQTTAATAIVAVAAAAIVPAVPIAQILRYPKEIPRVWHQGLPDEPQLTHVPHDKIRH